MAYGQLNNYASRFTQLGDWFGGKSRRRGAINARERRCLAHHSRRYLSVPIQIHFLGRAKGVFFSYVRRLRFNPEPSAGRDDAGRELGGFAGFSILCRPKRLVQIALEFVAGMLQPRPCCGLLCEVCGDNVIGDNCPRAHLLSQFNLRFVLLELASPDQIVPPRPGGMRPSFLPVPLHKGAVAKIQPFPLPASFAI